MDDKEKLLVKTVQEAWEVGTLDDAKERTILATCWQPQR